MAIVPSGPSYKVESEEVWKEGTDSFFVEYDMSTCATKDDSFSYFKKIYDRVRSSKKIAAKGVLFMRTLRHTSSVIVDGCHTFVK